MFEYVSAVLFCFILDILLCVCEKIKIKLFDNKKKEDPFHSFNFIVRKVHSVKVYISVSNIFTFSHLADAFPKRLQMRTMGKQSKSTKEQRYASAITVCLLMQYT